VTVLYGRFKNILCINVADKKLFTPGPLGCSQTVKEAMLRDLGSRDEEFLNVIKIIRQKLVDIGGKYYWFFMVSLACQKFFQLNLYVICPCQCNVGLHNHWGHFFNRNASSTWAYTNDNENCLAKIMLMFPQEAKSVLHPFYC
jgi:hypothetical protein